MITFKNRTTTATTIFSLYTANLNDVPMMTRLSMNDAHI